MERSGVDFLKTRRAGETSEVHIHLSLQNQCLLSRWDVNAKSADSTGHRFEEKDTFDSKTWIMAMQIRFRDQQLVRDRRFFGRG